MKYIIPVFLFLILFSLSSCLREKFQTEGTMNLQFSTDTVMFDTVFTNIGTATHRFSVYNRSGDNIRLSSIYIAKGSNSNFAINVDGMQGPTVQHVEIMSNDSIQIFVEANINPGRDEMIEKDSIVFEFGGSSADVKIIAFGQDVVLFKNYAEIETENWTNEKPYLIYNSVLLKEGNTLTIQEGSKIYFHYGSSLLINGTLQVQGALNAPVLFSSDRLEEFYRDKPGQWGAWITDDNGGTYLLGGIHFTRTSKNNTINYAIIENAIKGIQMDSVLDGTTTPGLKITNTIIRHINTAGIMAQTSSIEAHNLLVYNCQIYALALLYGGDYVINQSTIANYTPYAGRSEPAVVIQNYYESNGQIYAYEQKRTLFTNTIIYGFYTSGQPEISVNLLPEGMGHYMFDHCIVPTGNLYDTTDTNHFKNIVNAIQGVRFTDISKYNFTLDSLSIAKDKGNLIYGLQFPLDLNGKSRTADTKPDLGAYEL